MWKIGESRLDRPMYTWMEVFVGELGMGSSLIGSLIHVVSIKRCGQFYSWMQTGG